MEKPFSCQQHQPIFFELAKEMTWNLAEILKISSTTIWKKKFSKKNFRGFAWRKMGKKQPFLPIFGHFWPFETIWKLQNVLQLHNTWKTMDFIKIMKKFQCMTSSSALFRVSGGKNRLFCPFLPILTIWSHWKAHKCS